MLNSQEWKADKFGQRYREENKEEKKPIIPILAVPEEKRVYA